MSAIVFLILLVLLIIAYSVILYKGPGRGIPYPPATLFYHFITIVIVAVFFFPFPKITSYDDNLLSKYNSPGVEQCSFTVPGSGEHYGVKSEELPHVNNVVPGKYVKNGKQFSTVVTCDKGEPMFGLMKVKAGKDHSHVLTFEKK